MNVIAMLLASAEWSPVLLGTFSPRQSIALYSIHRHPGTMFQCTMSTSFAFCGQMKAIKYRLFILFLFSFHLSGICPGLWTSHTHTFLRRALTMSYGFYIYHGVCVWIVWHSGDNLSPEQVTMYLLDNPDFLEKHIMKEIELEQLERWMIRRTQQARKSAQSLGKNGRKTSLSR